MGYIDIGSVDFSRGIVNREKMTFENAPSRARRIISKGDVLVSTVRTYLRAITPVGETDGNLIASTGFAVIRAQTIGYHFLSYALKESRFVETVVACSVGVSYPACNSSDVGEIFICVPTEKEQQQLAVFLDRETSRIDELIAKQEKLIELSIEKRSALISQAVTRGLDTGVALKASGVEWFGEMPEHWERLPLTKYVTELSDYRGKTPEKVTEGIFLVTARNVRMGFIDYECSQEFVRPEEYEDIMRRGLPKKGDILFTMEAPLGNVALVDREDIALAQRIIRLQMNSQYLSSKFTLYALMASYFQSQLSQQATGSTAEGIKASKLFSLWVMAPPTTEQKVIAEYLDRETLKIDALIEKAQQAIDLMKEHRTSLIAAAVTGQIDVRG